MGGGGGDSHVTTDYVQYIKDAHQALIWRIEDELDNSTGNSPFASYPGIDIDPGFFGIGFVLSSFPSLYDMFGKFMAGLDVDALYNQLFLDTTTGPLITNLTGEQAIELSDDVEQNILPRFEVGMRDINAVMSSTFVVGRSVIEATRIKALSKFDAELRYRLIPTITDRWAKHLDWNKNVIDIYANILKLFISAKIDTLAQYYEYAGKDGLWNFTILDNYRMAVAALHGANRVTSDVQGGPTQTQKVLGGAMSGAAVGTEIYAGWGTAIGAVVGAAAGYFL